MYFSSNITRINTLKYIYAITYLGFVLKLYSFLKKYNEKLALRFLSFRIIASHQLLLDIESPYPQSTDLGILQME
jgi:hypothetical protein